MEVDQSVTPIPVSSPTPTSAHLPQSSVSKPPSSPRTVSFHFLPFPYSQQSSTHHRQLPSITEGYKAETKTPASNDIAATSRSIPEETSQNKRLSTSTQFDSEMGRSIESSRPIMAGSVTSKRASARFSTYSQAPSLTPTSLTSDSAHAEITNIEEGLEKLENKKLATQRYVLNPEKSENMSKLALGAKLERALGRRMGGQDAEFRVRKKVVVDSEKVSEKQVAA